MKEVEEEKDCFCLFHQAGLGHTIQDCLEFLNLVQRMIDDREIEFCRKVEGNMVVVTQGGSSGNGQQEGMPKPLIIYYKRGHQTKITP